MRVRAHDMRQAGEHSRPVTVVTVVLMVVTVLMAVVVVRAAHAVHDIQHARENALPHIHTYQGRALAS
jgi:hypothetical protein